MPGAGEVLRQDNVIAFFGGPVNDFVHNVLHNLSSETAGLQSITPGAYSGGIGRFTLIGQLEDKSVRFRAELELNAAIGPVFVGVADFVGQGFLDGKGDRARFRIVPSQSQGQISNSMPHCREKTNVARYDDFRFDVGLRGGHGFGHRLFLIPGKTGVTEKGCELPREFQKVRPASRFGRRFNGAAGRLAGIPYQHRGLLRGRCTGRGDVPRWGTKARRSVFCIW